MQLLVQLLLLSLLSLVDAKCSVLTVPYTSCNNHVAHGEKGCKAAIEYVCRWKIKSTQDIANWHWDNNADVWRGVCSNVPIHTMSGDYTTKANINVHWDSKEEHLIHDGAVCYSYNVD